MKKFFGILVAVMICVCACVPACAADLDLSALTSALGDVDISNLSADEISDILGVDLGELEAVLGELENAESGDIANEIISKFGLSSNGEEAPVAKLDADVTTTAAAGGGIGDALGGIGDALGGLTGGDGGVDLSAITGLFEGIDISSIGDTLSSGDALSSITGMFEGIDMSSFDISALTDTISGAFGDSGFDISSITSGLDLGSFDISSILGGIGGGSSDDSSAGDSSGSSSADSGISDKISGIADTLKSGLEGLGLDTSMVEGLLDNDIVNFFANMYIGLGQVDKTEETTTAVATTKPKTTKATPNTGDSSSVFAAIGVLSVASAAAFVCLKKKNSDN